jgi:hypothetical protein
MKNGGPLPEWQIAGGEAVRELWSADRDFSRFGAVKVHNPLLAQFPQK